MKVIKKNFTFSIKKSVNYNSVSINEGIEVEYDADDLNSRNLFENLKSSLKDDVIRQVNEEVDKLSAKPKEKKVDLLG